MDISSAKTRRREFLGVTAGAAVAGAIPASAQQQAQPKTPSISDSDFSTQIALGGAVYIDGNPGKVFAVTSKIKEGDSESAFQAWNAAGIESREWAESAAAKDHHVSARQAYLWAASYFSTAMRLLDGTADASRMLPTWEQHDKCWSAAAALFHPPVERVQVPYEKTTLTGWFFRVDSSKQRRPLVILNNGADGLETSMYRLGAAGAVERGYNALVVNGPGQCDSLWVKKLYFRPDWEKVITPVVDFAVAHREVDPKRIALIGVSQGGHWVPRAVAFEHRIAAAVADPGIHDVSEAWLKNIPKPFLAQLDDPKNKPRFDAMVSAGLKMNPKAKVALDFRMRPYGIPSFFDQFRAIREYNLKDVASQIRCPMLITNPESEQFFPGQSKQLYDMLNCPKTIVDFTRDQGADLHCEVNAPGYRDFCIYNWLDETLRSIV